MSAKQVRVQFLCEKRQLEFKHDFPSSLVGPAALGNPAMPEMFTTVMRPIVLQHAEAALQACEDKCSAKGCTRDASTVVATPMSVSANSITGVVALQWSLTGFWEGGEGEEGRQEGRVPISRIRPRPVLMSEHSTSTRSMTPLSSS